MTAFLAALGRALVAQLPPTLVRIFLALTLIGALALHLWASSRLTVLEHEGERLKSADVILAEQNKHVLLAVAELTEEVRGYRADMREENKALRARLRQQQNH